MPRFPINVEHFHVFKKIVEPSHIRTKLQEKLSQSCRHKTETRRYVKCRFPGGPQSFRIVKDGFTAGKSICIYVRRQCDVPNGLWGRQGAFL